MIQHNCYHVKKLQTYILLLILFFLSACSCGCDPINTDIKSGYVISDSSMYIWADGCGDATGDLNSDGYPMLTSGGCDGVSQYINRGRWIKANNSGVAIDSRINIGINGSIFYCSFGYDNYRPTSNVIVTPSSGIVSSTVAVSSGEFVVVEVLEGPESPVTLVSQNTVEKLRQKTSSITNDLNKIKNDYIPHLEIETFSQAIQDNTTILANNNLSFPTTSSIDNMIGALDTIDTALEQNSGPYKEGIKTTCDAIRDTLSYIQDNILDSLPTTLCGTYTDFLNGNCSGSQGFGLTNYVGNTKIITLDNMDAPNSYYPNASIRRPFLFSSVPSNELQSLYDDTNATYGIRLNDSGMGKYIFQVPQGVNGNLRFAIAQSENGQPSSPSGYGQYTLKINTTPSSCYVQDAEATNQPGLRGAVEMLTSTTNPNDIDSIVNSFTNLQPASINGYYQELSNYINSHAGISITGNSLAGLVVSPPTSLKPLTLTSSEYVGDSESKGNLWFRIRDDYYNDNVGGYYISVKTISRQTNDVSQFIEQFTTPTVKAINLASRIIYNNFASVHYLNILRLCLWIYLVIYGASFMLGLTEIAAQDILIRSIKIGVVVELFQPNSWEFFNTYIFNIFLKGNTYLLKSIGDSTTGGSLGMFSFVDDVFNIFFAQGTWIKIASLLPSLVGILFAFILIFVMVTYLMTLARVVISYLLSVIAIGVLLSLAPMFLVLILFERTKKFFDNWIKHLVDYTLEPVIMFTALYVMNAIFMNIWNGVMNFKVCWGKALHISLPLPQWTFSFWPSKINLGCVQWYIRDSGSILDIIVAGFTLLIMAFSIKGLIGHVPQIVTHITGVSGAAALSAATNKIVQQGLDMSQQGIQTAKKVANVIPNLMDRGKKDAPVKESGAQGSATGGDAGGGAKPPITPPSTK